MKKYSEGELFDDGLAKAMLEKYPQAETVEVDVATGTYVGVQSATGPALVYDTYVASESDARHERIVIKRDPGLDHDTD